MRRIIAALSLILYYALVASVWLGFLYTPVGFHYPKKILILLLGLLLFFLLAPVVLYYYKKSVGWKGLAYSLLPALALVIVIYGVLSLRYYYTRKYLFEPFLQFPPPKIENRLAEKPDHTFRVLFLGGSTTKDSNLPEEQRYPKVVERLLRAHYPDDSIAVVNAGQDWYTTKHLLINYVTHGSDLQPDVVVVMEAINDLYRSFSSPGYALGPYNDQWSHFYGPAYRGANPPTFEGFLWGRYFQFVEKAWYGQYRLVAVDYPLERFRSIHPFEQNLRRIIRHVRATNALLVLVSQPFLFRDDLSARELGCLWFAENFCRSRRGIWQYETASPKSLVQAMNAYNQASAEVAQEAGITFVDGAAALTKTLENFVDDVHYTEQGAATLARVVADAIIQAGWVEKKVGIKKQPSR